MGIFSFLGKSNTVYFPGCMTFFKHKEHFELYKEIFSKLGIDFRVLDKQICCGLPALESGYENDARRLIRKNFEILKEQGVKTIITNSPCCYKMLLQDYPNMMPDWNIEVKNVWRIILEKLQEKPKLIKNRVISIAAYQDSCYLGRYCNIYDEPRRILDLIGYEIKEFPNNKDNSFCCGSCGALPITNPQLADKIAKEKISQAKRIGVKRIIVNSLEDYDLLKKNSENTGISIIEFSEILAEALGITNKLEIKEKEENVEEILSQATGEKNE